ncbi:ABC transporter permease [Sulfurimonas sp.]|uniref:ABC transporter permease n=1 Tax=Sulfurimonas sp. TaxID=2022749 RepID=UPI0035665BF6
MRVFLNQLLALMKKEFLAIWSDKKSRIIIIVPPILQLFLFSFAVTLEVKNISIGIIDRDNSVKSQELIRALQYSNSFTNVYRIDSQKDIQKAIDTQKVIAVIHIPQEFSKSIQSKRKTTIQIIADGRKSNTAQITQSYIQNAINTTFNSSYVQQNIIVNRNLYNPNLDNFWWILPSLIGTISMIVALLLTALSVARERELGTFEQIMVTPLSSTALIIGKTIPPLLISIVDAFVIFTLSVVLFGVPFVGSFFILLIGMISFLFSIVGLGLFISSIVSTQQQGILGAFVLLVPYILMSGFATPVENMPEWLIPFTDIVSLKYFLILLKGVFLKDIGYDIALTLIIPMLILGFISLSAATLMFRKKVA